MKPAYKKIILALAIICPGEGTALQAQAYRIHDIFNGLDSGNPTGMMVVGNRLYFSANNGTHGNELWSYTGVDTPRMVADLSSGFSSSNPVLQTLFRGRLIFSSSSPAFGNELWIVSSGGNPQLIADLNPGNASSNPSEAVVFRDTLYFQANNGSSGAELYRYDGTNMPVLVADIETGGSSSYPTGMTLFRDKLFFRAETSNAGAELWVYDAQSPPAMVADINPGGSSSNPAGFTVFKDKLYFSADNGVSGSELWVYDGINAPELVMDIHLTGSSNPSGFSIVDTLLVFRAENEEHGSEIWATDGINPPFLFMDLVAGPKSSEASDFTPYFGKMYFSAWDSTYGRELWIRDEAGYKRVTDINPGDADADPKWLVVFKNRLLFQAGDPAAGAELWALCPVVPITYLEANSCGPYLWNGMMYESSGTYLDTFPGQFGCDSIVQLTLSVTNVDTSVVDSSGTLKALQSQALYQWLDCNNGMIAVSGATSRTFTAQTLSRYAVEITKDGCKDTSGCHLAGDVGLGQKHRPVFTIIPNPSSGEFMLRAFGPTEDLELWILDFKGRLILDHSLDPTKNQWNQVLDPGVYLIRIRRNDQVLAEFIQWVTE